MGKIEKVLEKKPIPKSKQLPKEKAVIAEPPPVVEVISESLKGDISTILVSSAAGCIGSYLTRCLLKEGYEVTAVDKKVDNISVR